MKAKTIENIARAFWRRIEMYKNDYGKELPEELPVEFRASMETALMLLDSDTKSSIGNPLRVKTVKQFWVCSTGEDIESADPKDNLASAIELRDKNQATEDKAGGSEVWSIFAELDV